jgi:thymidylate kinase
LARVLEAIDRAGLAYCVPHGLAGSPTADVDLVVTAEVGASGVAAILRDNGLDVVRCLSGHVVIADRAADGLRSFIDLDVSTDYNFDGRRFYTADEILMGRRLADGYYQPAAAIAFGCLLARRIAKGRLTKDHERRLNDLFRQDSDGCRKQIERFWGAESAAILAAAPDTGNWSEVRRDLGRMRGELLRRATVRQPLRVTGRWLGRNLRRLRRYVHPAGGVGVIFLGPDGAGKSTLIEEVRRQLAGAFSTSTVLQFPPALLRRALGRAEGPVQLPHALPPRSPLSSVARAVGYWLVYYTLGYWLSIRPALARSTLALHDRHLLDAVVDPTRYRYASPRWLLRLVWRLIPKADLVILLDAPAEVLQARKHEVPLEVTVRQREDYRKLIGGLKNGYVVSTARPVSEAVDEVTGLILGELRRRGRP